MADRIIAEPHGVKGKLVDVGGGIYAQQRYIAGGTVTASDGGGSLTVDDGGGSLTVDGTMAVTGALTDAELRASAVAVADGGGSLTVDGPLTDTQLRASAVDTTLDVPGSGLALIGTKLRVSAMPYLYDIAEGNVAGHAGWSKIGFNGDIGTNEEDLWTAGGQYVWPAAGMQMQVVSTSGNDTSGGVGVKTVTIRYLDSAYNSQAETVTMNGLTPVNTVTTDIFRVQSFRAATCGGNGAAAGTITLKDAATATTTYSQIQAGYTRARNITYTVPAAKVLHITSLTFSVYGATKGIRFTTRATYDPDTAAVTTFFLPYTEVTMGNGAFYRPLEIPTTFPATTRIKVSGVADAAGAVCTTALRGWIEDA